MTRNDLIGVLKTLSAVARKSRVKIVLMGGMATSVYASPRATFDIDGLADIGDEALSGFLKTARGEGFTFDRRRPVKAIRDMAFLTLFSPRGGIYVDLFLARSDYQKQVIERARSVRIDGLTAHIVSPEDLILLKLLSGRPRDTEDVRQILIENKRSLDPRYLLSRARELGVHTFLQDELRSLEISFKSGGISLNPTEKRGK
jgi:hypothetical protein